MWRTLLAFFATYCLSICIIFPLKSVLAKPNAPPLAECADGSTFDHQRYPAVSWVCKHIVEAAKEKPNITGAFVIDFNRCTKCKGKLLVDVPSRIVSQLMTGKDYLDSKFHGGIVLKNFRIIDPLIIHGARVRLPVTLQNILFHSGKVHSPALASGPITASLIIDNSVFEHPLVISDAHFQESVVISNNDFRSGIVLRRADLWRQEPIDNTVSTDDSLNSALLIRKNKVFPSFLIEGFLSYISPFRKYKAVSEKTEGGIVGYKDVRIDFNEIGRLYIKDSSFYPVIWIFQNKIESFRSFNNLFSDLVVQSNTFSGSILIQETLFGASLGRDTPQQFTIAANIMPRGFLFLNNHISKNVLRADLTFNELKGHAAFFIPKIWQGHFDLTGTDSTSLLRIRRGSFLDQASRPKGKDFFDQYSRCGLSDGLWMPAALANETEDNNVLVNLTTAKIKTLSFDIFPVCDVYLTASGLRFEHWGEPEGELQRSNTAGLPMQDAENISEFDLTLLLLWTRRLLGPNVDFLTFVSDYLERQGRTVESRAVKRRAKLSNYQSVPEAAGPIENAVSWILIVLLAPVGWGANSEWALGLIFLNFLTFGLIYSHIGGGGFKSISTTNETAPFQRFDSSSKPDDFSPWRFSADSALPVINLHAYDRYYIASRYRWLPAIEHVLGWWFSTIFIASLAIL